MSDCGDLLKNYPMNTVMLYEILSGSTMAVSSLGIIKSADKKVRNSFNKKISCSTHSRVPTKNILTRLNATNKTTISG